MPKNALSPLLVAAHLAACAAFLILREPGISFPAERERERRESGYFFINSADAYTFIAERPLYNWSEWHGGEETWVKVLAVINLPSLILTATIGGVVIAVYRLTGFGDYPADTWIRALFFLAFSLVQWWTVGYLINKALRRMIASPSRAAG